MSPPRLTEASLHAARSARSCPPTIAAPRAFGIVHIGPGAFHRAHQAYYVDTLLHSDKRWAISALSLKSTGLRDALGSAAGPVHADGARRRAARARHRRDSRIAGGRDRLPRRPSRGSPRAIRASSRSPSPRRATASTRRISSTWRTPTSRTTLPIPAQPRSTIGWIVEGLRRRRAQGVPPFAVLSCDNLPDNGAVLHRALVAFAAARTPTSRAGSKPKSSARAPWSTASRRPPTTHCASAPRNSPACIDEWPIQREPFTQWVIEDVPAMRDADWASVGVTLAKDVERLRPRQAAAAERPAFDARLSRAAARPRVRRRRHARRTTRAIRRDC